LLYINSINLDKEGEPMLSESLENFFNRLNLSTLSIPSIRITDIVDIILVSVIIYIVVRWIRETRAWTLFRGLLVIAVISLISFNFHFYTLSFIIEKSLSVGVIAVVIIFQPELRRGLEQIGSKGFAGVAGILNVADNEDTISTSVINSIINACLKMAESKTGALIVIERSMSLDSIMRASGVTINGDVSEQLIMNIFVDKTPLHDGAVIIRNNKIASASCILPVTQVEIGQEFGTRHRAAVGASEMFDAIIIVVSEETGKISIAQNGRLEKRVTEAQFRRELMKLVTTEDSRINKIWKGRNKNEQKN
jgi:diadenylate cyclase